MDRPNDRSRPGRPAASWSACKRLKRKCDRQWPCSNCQARKAAPLKTLELDLGESAENLSCGYQETAKLLGDYVSPGEGGLAHVQQLFLSSTWLKTRAEYVKSWYSLALAIREAEEIGMHLDSEGPNILEIEREMRRRLCTENLWINDMNDPASSQIDLGALNGAWDWNGLNFNPFYE